MRKIIIDLIKYFKSKDTSEKDEKKCISSLNWNPNIVIDLNIKNIKSRMDKKVHAGYTFLD
jgi:hypothetical protein